MKDTAHHEQAAVERPSLYVVATPIGNLADITLRALDVLKRVSAIAAEDTRVTLRLLKHYGIAAPLITLHQHNERDAARKILHLLAQESPWRSSAMPARRRFPIPAQLRSPRCGTPVIRWCRCLAPMRP